MSTFKRSKHEHQLECQMLKHKPEPEHNPTRFPYFKPTHLNHPKGFQLLNTSHLNHPGDISIQQ